MKTTYTNEQLQEAIDVAFRESSGDDGFWLGIARAFLDNLPEQTEQEVLSLSQLRPLSKAGEVPEGCVRYYTYKKDGEWTSASRWPCSRDTHYIEVRLPYLDPEYKPSTEPLEIKPWTPAVGDVVTLKSGGPKMTVMQDMGHKFLCAYDFHGEVKTVSISTNCLQPA